MADKPRILNGPSDLIWSLVPLVAMSIIIAAIGAQCSFSPGGPKAGPVPHFDVAAGLRADAANLSFPIRDPRLPVGWQPNSGSHDTVPDPEGGRVTTVGYITPGGRYLAYLQSDASVQALTRYVDADLTASGTRRIGGHTWVVYAAPRKESSWVVDLGNVRELIHGAGNATEYANLADAITAAVPSAR